MVVAVTGEHPQIDTEILLELHSALSEERKRMASWQCWWLMGEPGMRSGSSGVNSGGILKQIRSDRVTTTASSLRLWSIESTGTAHCMPLASRSTDRAPASARTVALHGSTTQHGWSDR